MSEEARIEKEIKPKKILFLWKADYYPTEKNKDFKKDTNLLAKEILSHFRREQDSNGKSEDDESTSKKNLMKMIAFTIEIEFSTNGEDVVSMSRIKHFPDELELFVIKEGEKEEENRRHRHFSYEPKDTTDKEKILQVYININDFFVVDPEELSKSNNTANPILKFRLDLVKIPLRKKNGESISYGRLENRIDLSVSLNDLLRNINKEDDKLGSINLS